MSLGGSEYLYTFGIIVAFAGLIAGTVLERENIKHVLKSHRLTRKKLLVAVVIAALFVVFELVTVKPTQLLFFDDAIYQGMAQNLLHSGQAWMCDYGTPATCFSGELFHEPIGLSANIAIGFALFGVKLWVTHAVELALTALAVFMTFLVALLLLKDIKAAYFSELLMALSPVVLVWAMPTNSDMALLAYSLVALFFLLVFVEKKSRLGLMNALLAVSITLYMKVFAALYLPLFALIYLVLDDKNLLNSLRKNLKRAMEYMMDTRVLLVLLIFVIVMAPVLDYAAMELGSGDFGYQGTTIQQTCNFNMPGIKASGNINLANFGANICSNVLFWFGQYDSIYVMQPALFTALAIIGAVIMLYNNGRRLFSIGLWFLVFFLLYTSFYAGSVIYGVDWRFMLSLIAQACLFGGFAVSMLVTWAGQFAKRIAKNSKLAGYAIAAVAIVILASPICLLMPKLSVSTAGILQAPDARFYEGFVYNESSAIPQNCIVYTYDPPLFNLNNRTAIQIGDMYNTSQLAKFEKQYGCIVLDYGYWCHTPNSLCGYANRTFNLTPIRTANFSRFGYTYGFYYLTEK